MGYAARIDPMLHRLVACLTGVCLVLSAAAPGVAQIREFAGRVAIVTSSKLVVDSPMGDQLTFVLSPKTRVRGAKRDLGEIRPADQVTVHWSSETGGPAAERVVVHPPR